MKRLVPALLLLAACGEKTTPSRADPEHIEVQHILVGFEGRLPGKNIRRSKSEAETLAKNVLDRARSGESFDDLVKQYTDDQVPGVYRLANNGVDPSPGEAGRNGMVPGFGDVSFGLKVGEIGLAEYDSRRSPYGWHIVKRLK